MCSRAVTRPGARWRDGARQKADDCARGRMQPTLWAAVIGLTFLAGCAAPAPPPKSYDPPIWTTPEWQREQAARKQRGDDLLKRWVACRIDKARALSRSDLPAMVVVAQATLGCKAEREEWVRSQISPGVSRELAEDVASGSEEHLVPLIRDYVIDLRAAHARRAPPPPPPTIPQILPPLQRGI